MSFGGDRRSAAVTTHMTTAATPDLLFAVVIDDRINSFDVYGPLIDDTWLMNAVCGLQEAGFNVTTKTRPQRGPNETLEMAAAAVGRELELVYRPGLLRRRSAWASS